VIENDRQYEVSKQQAAKLEQALRDFPRDPSSRPHIHPKLQEAERHAIEDLLDRVNAEMADYEALVTGTRTVIFARELDELPLIFRRAREVSRTSAADVARMAGISEDELLEYERTDFADAPYRLIIDIARILDLSVRDSIAISAPVDEDYLAELKQQIRSPFERLSTADSTIHD
jgi:hypothetical protein